MRRTASLAVVVVLGALVAGCTAKSGGTGAASPPPTPVVSASSAPASASPTPSVAKNPACVDQTTGWSTEVQSVPVNSIDSAVVDKVDTGKHECFDQITFTTTTIAPIGYDVRYAGAVTT